MIRWVIRWMLRLVLVVTLLVVGLLLPVAWVEFACVGDREEQPYAALLPEDHHRAEARALLTYPEWHIVHAYDDYAQVIKTGDPHEFGYVKAVGTYWSSLCALKKRASAHGGIDAETKQLVYVIGVSFSAELALKAAYEETLGRVATWIRGAERTRLDQLSFQQAQGYAKFLQQTPWYKWDFQADIAAMEASQTLAFRDTERRFALGNEYAMKSAYAKVIANAVANVGADELTLRMIVTGPDLEALKKTTWVRVIAERLEGLEIEAPRYRELTDLLVQRMSRMNLVIVEMAGNDDIMFTAIGSNPTHPSALFSFARQGYDDYRHLFMVKTRDLLAILDERREGPLTVEHVHDY